ncbi:MAG TPA: DUF5677 domain-containing protein [Kofleriaceae bacterium]|jgi:hypothetical protein|nr:DUF5677 domain-containing protein [Kofleriaceae bacterium]
MMVAKEVALEIERRFEKQVAYVWRLHELGRRAIEDGHAVATTGDVSHRLALSMLSRGTSALHSVELLFCGGLETDAMSALRIIAELLIDYEWIWKEDREARIKLFVEHIMIINQRKLVRWINPPGQPVNTNLADKLFAQIDPAHRPHGIDTAEKYMQWIEAEYQRVRGNYDEFKSWAGISIRKRAQQTGLMDTYDLPFALGSEATHSGAATLTGHYRIEDGTVSMVYGPTVPTSAWVLALASQVYGHLLEVVADHLGFAALRSELGALGGEFLAVFATVTAT